MAVFTLNDGRLVSAPSHPKLDAAETEELLGAVRREALGLLDHQLFEVGWYHWGARDEHQDSLLALDPTGRIVTVEVHEKVDAQVLLAALARAGRHADFSRGQLASIYPGGRHAFSSDWSNFVETTVPVTGNRPRLFLFAIGYSQDVLAPIAALNGAGVEAHRILLHAGANGVLVELSRVGHQPMGILGRNARTVELEAVDRPDAQAHPSEPSGQTQEVPGETMKHLRHEDPADDDAAAAETSSVPDDSGEPEQDAHIDEDLWNITGWNSTQVPRPHRFRAPSQPEPVNPDKNPVFAEMTSKSPEETELPELDPQLLAEFEEFRAARRSRTDTAIMLAEMTPAPAPKSANEQPNGAEAKGAEAKATEEQPKSVPAQPAPTAPTPVLEQPKAVQSDPAPAPQKSVQQDPVPAPQKSVQQDPVPAPRPRAKRPSYSMYDELMRESQPLEQRIWEDSAPSDDFSRSLIDERDSARFSQDAVARAAADKTTLESLPAYSASSATAAEPQAHTDEPQGHADEPNGSTDEPNARTEPYPELVELAASMGGTAPISWVSLRKRLSASAIIRTDGLIELETGTLFADPDDAAAAVSGGHRQDGWRVWQLADGRRLSDFRR